jgi:hypothetical protein
MTGESYPPNNEYVASAATRSMRRLQSSGEVGVTERPMRPERLQIMLTPEELQALDDFRFQSRMPSRAAAIRELLKRGLSSEGFVPASFGRKSESFGVLAADPSDTGAETRRNGNGNSRGD